MCVAGYACRDGPTFPRGSDTGEKESWPPKSSCSMHLMQPSNHGLKRELKLRDLVLMQILVIVSLNISGYAAKQGRSQVVLWLLAMALFYLPQGAIVIWLSRAIPLEGGAYQWVKQGVSPFAGYMAAWTFTLYIICWYASFGSQVASGIAYVGGSSSAWMSTSKVFTLSMTVTFCLVAFFLNVRGLHVTKWLSGAGSLLVIVVFLIMVYLLLRPATKAESLPEVAFSLAWPGFSLLSVNVFTKMSLFALSGLDQCSIFSEECRKPKNDVARSVFIAAPFIALMYIASTSTVLAYIPVAKVDLAAPVPQGMQAGFGPTAAARGGTCDDGADGRLDPAPSIPFSDHDEPVAFIDLLASIAKEMNATPAQIALAWLLAQKPWIVPIPGTTKLSRLEENIGAVGIELAEAELRTIDEASSKIKVEGDPIA